MQVYTWGSCCEELNTMMANACLYAAKNNNAEVFKTQDGLKPCVLYVSLELTSRQCIERDLSWLGIQMASEDIAKLTDQEVSDLLLDERKKQNFRIPMFYSIRPSLDMKTSASDIEDEVNDYRNRGFQVVMMAVDYLDRMSPDDYNIKGFNKIGAEGAALLIQKAKELRDMSIKLGVVTVSGAQLNSNAFKIYTECKPYIKKVDPCLLYGAECLAGATNLGQEAEMIIFLERVDIEERNDQSDAIETKSYLEFTRYKFRDKPKEYRKSQRDESVDHLYWTYTTNLKNNREIGSKIISTASQYHAVVPLRGMRLDEYDYGRSIRVYYTNEASGFTDLQSITNNVYKAGPVDLDAEFNDLLNGS